MRKIIVLTIFVAVVLLFVVFWQKSKRSNFQPILETNSVSMRIFSPAFKNNQYIPKKYTCDGENINPPLEFLDIPEKAESLVLIVDDPDAPRGDWVHWTVWNIPSSVRIIPENTVPQGAVEGTTSFGSVGWGGPCPPSGTHRYFFRLYALNTRLNLPPGASFQELKDVMTGHVLDQAELVGLYQRK